MRKVVLVAVMAAVVLSGCAIHATKDIVDELQTDKLYSSFDVKPINLKARSKCASPPSLKILNVSANEEIDMRPDEFGLHLLANRKELADGLIDYLKQGYRKSQINVDDSSDKAIRINLKELKLVRGVWVLGGAGSVDVSIPETKYSEVYSARDNAVDKNVAFAYVLHALSRRIIDDPVIQDYILCR